MLARNVIKSMMEGRRGLPFGRFRAKLVLALLGMTVIPAVLVLIVGSRVVLTAVDRWFNAPMEEILAGANSIAGDYYQERERLVADQASRLARSLSRIDLALGRMSRPCRTSSRRKSTGQRIGMVQVYRAVRAPNQPPDVRVAGRRRVAVDAARLGARRRRIAWRRAPPAATKRRRASRSRWPPAAC